MAAYFAQEMLATRGQSLEGKTVSVSGSGNVAQYSVEKAMQLGAKVVTVSDLRARFTTPKASHREAGHPHGCEEPPLRPRE